MASNVLAAIHSALHDDDATAVQQILDQHPELKANIDKPLAEFGSPAILHVASRAMLDVFLNAGADINARSKWWAGSFGLLDQASPELSAYALERGATLTVHAAARLGMVDALRKLIATDPALIHARGGDGQTPLHFASTVEIAEFLVQQGADVNARDVDHESTPAQWMLSKRPEVARYLVQQGSRTDILMAAALGDNDLARRHLEADPDSIRTRVSDEYFPKTNPHSGGTIYQWELGWHVSAVQVAKKFGHTETFNFLNERSPADEQLLNACWLHGQARVHSLLAANPDLASQLTPSGQRQLAHAARNNDTAAAALMLEAGLPVNVHGQHHATPLHWAAWHGNAELARLILKRNPPLATTDNDFQGTPVNWAVHGSQNGWYCSTGDYPATLEVLLDAGVPLPEQTGGTEAVRGVLARHGLTS